MYHGFLLNLYLKSCLFVDCGSINRILLFKLQTQSVFVSMKICKKQHHAMRRKLVVIALLQ